MHVRDLLRILKQCLAIHVEAQKKNGAYGTRDSHVVPHHSTNLACTGLTSQFGRDTVCYREYGRRHH